MKHIRKKNLWYSWGGILILFGGLLLSVLGFLDLREDEKQQVRTEFIREMDHRYASLDRELNLHKEFLLGLKGLFDASDDVSRTDFDKYVKPVLSRIEGIQAVEWIPFVPRSKKLVFEEEARSDGFTDFVFTQRAEQGQMVPVEERAAYYPVYYLVPLEGNEAAFGFDLGSSATRLQTLKQARDTGEVLVTPRITLVQEKGSQAGVLQFVPVYEGEPKAVGERRLALRGFVLGVHRLGDIVNYSLSKVANEEAGINSCLVDISTPKGEGKLYASKFWTGTPESRDYYYERRIMFAGEHIKP